MSMVKKEKKDLVHIKGSSKRLDWINSITLQRIILFVIIL